MHESCVVPITMMRNVATGACNVGAGDTYLVVTAALLPFDRAPSIDLVAADLRDRDARMRRVFPDVVGLLLHQHLRRDQEHTLAAPAISEESIDHLHCNKGFSSACAHHHDGILLFRFTNCVFLIASKPHIGA